MSYDSLSFRNRPLVLIGLMGAGKTTIGKHLAQTLSLPFVDSDIEIERTAGCSISDIFEQYGEAEFRRVEWQVISRLLEQKSIVLATGGGAFMDPKTRAFLKENATTIWLHCPLEVLLKRVENRTHRPLLNSGDKREILASLIKIRHPIYAEADLLIQYKPGSIETTIEHVLQTLQKASSMRVLPVDLKTSQYNVTIGPDLLEQAGVLLYPLLKQKRVIIIADETVANLHLTRLTDSLHAVDIQFETILIPPGEQSKSFSQYERVTNTVLEKGLERQTTLIAFGGGVTGDLAGFVAATVLRGVPFIQIPTTLLSQVDSSVGGKTGINTRTGKNLLGAFYQPKTVIADISTLSTLPVRELRAGYAEIVKAGLINDPDLFSWCEQYGEQVIAKNTEMLSKAVEQACAFKAKIVKEDEYEQNAKGRNLLNLGHSFGHALEAEFNYDGRLLHGEAVALGICMIFRLCVSLEICPKADLDRVVRHFSTTGLLTSLSELSQDLKLSRIMDHMRHDKKVKDGKIAFVLVQGIGKAFISNTISEEQITSFLLQEGCVRS